MASGRTSARISQIEFEHSIDFTPFSAKTHGLLRKNAFTHWISIVFSQMQKFTMTYVTFGLFHMGNLGSGAWEAAGKEAIGLMVFFMK